jgi:inhibitor of KinA
MINPSRYFEYNSGVLLVEWPKGKNLNTLHSIQIVDNQLNSHYSNFIYETVPGYHSLLVYYNHKQLDNIVLETFISKIKEHSENLQESKHWEIPVKYDTNYGLDLDFLSEELQLTINEIINLHSSPTYTIHFIGFLPGFIYLSGLPKELDIPRRKDPRIRIPRGSVALAAGQTGIYPVDSPGGWHIIGRSSASLFDPFSDPPSIYNSGDTVRFINIAQV